MEKGPRDLLKLYAVQNMEAVQRFKPQPAWLPSLQDMARRGAYGHVINLCCLDGHNVAEAGEGNGFYAATKHAVRAMTEALRQEERRKYV